MCYFQAVVLQRHMSNIDYAPLDDLRAKMLINTGNTLESLPRPVAKRFVSQEAKKWMLRREYK